MVVSSLGGYVRGGERVVEFAWLTGQLLYGQWLHGNYLMVVVGGWLVIAWYR